MAPPRLAEKTENIRRIDRYFPRLKPKKNANDAVKRETPGEDTISLLPVDCLLSIFSQLGRRSLNEMKCVSKKMSIVAHETCKKVKWIAEKLILRRGCRGYSVTRAGCRMVVYTIRRKKRGLKRCGTMIEGKGQIVKRRIEEDFDESDHAGYDEPRETCSYCRAPESLPEQFYDLIKKFTDDFTFDSITLINIPINEEFIDRIIPLFKGIEMEGTLSLYNSPIDKDLSMQKLSILIASLNARRFDPSGPHFPWDSLNEKFIIDFPSSKLSLGTIKTFLHKIHRFTPTSDFVAVLARFDILEFPGLILDQSVILGALKMKFASCDRYMCWEISTNSEDFDFSILGPEFTVTTNKWGWLKMEKKGLNGSFAIEISEEYSYEPYRAYIHFSLDSD